MTPAEQIATGLVVRAIAHVRASRAFSGAGRATLLGLAALNLGEAYGVTNRMPDQPRRHWRGALARMRNAITAEINTIERVPHAHRA